MVAQIDMDIHQRMQLAVGIEAVAYKHIPPGMTGAHTQALLLTCFDKCQFDQRVVVDTLHHLRLLQQQIAVLGGFYPG